MDTTVTELLRAFPKIRRAALRGDKVRIHTRDGVLVLQREAPARALYGSLSNHAEDRGLDANEHVLSADEWGQ